MLLAGGINMTAEAPSASASWLARTASTVAGYPVDITTGMRPPSLVNGDPRHPRALRLAELGKLAAEGNPEAVNAGVDAIVDLAPQAVLVHPVFQVERGLEDGDDTADGRHGLWLRLTAVRH